MAARSTLGCEPIAAGGVAPEGAIRPHRCGTMDTAGLAARRCGTMDRLGLAARRCRTIDRLGLATRRSWTFGATCPVGLARTSHGRPHAVPLSTLPLGRLGSGSRVAMLAARSPVFSSRRLKRGLTTRALRLLRRIPQTPVREPLHHDVGVRAAQLIERRQQVVGLRCAKRGWAVVDEEGPVREARRHDEVR